MTRKNKRKIKLLPGEIRIDIRKEIRQAAKIILKVLARHGRIKIAELPKEIKLLPGEGKIDIKKEIKLAANIMRAMLSITGKIKTSRLQRMLNLNSMGFHMAVGWLAWEDAIGYSRVKRTYYIWLLPKRKLSKRRV